MFLSTIAGLFRGFVKDFFGARAWFGAGFISVFVSPYLIPTMSKYIDNVTAARCAAMAAAYLIALIFLLITIGYLSKIVEGSVFSGVDKAAGALFGFTRGAALLICCCGAAIIMELPRDEISIVKESKICDILFKIAEQLTPAVVKELKEFKKAEIKKLKSAKRKMSLEEAPIKGKGESEEGEADLIEKTKDAVAETLAKFATADDEGENSSENDDEEDSPPRKKASIRRDATSFLKKEVKKQIGLKKKK
jgi:membrane protein required for colicin V production